jgi:hypothetical protein
VSNRKVRDPPGSEAARMAETRAEVNGLKKDLAAVVKEARELLDQLGERCAELQMLVVDATSNRADDLIEVAMAGKVSQLTDVIDTQFSRALNVVRVRFDEIYRTMEGEMSASLGIDVHKLARMVGARRRDAVSSVPEDAQAQRSLHLGVFARDEPGTP